MIDARVPYFCRPERIVALGVAVAGWLETPFRAASAAPGPGGGVDCVRLAEALLRETGAIPAVAFPRYRIDSGSHLDQSPLLDFLRGPQLHDHLLEISLDAPRLPGDVLVIRAGRTPYHLGVAVSTEGDFVHVLAGREVTLATLRDATYGERLRAVFRPVVERGEAAP